MTKKIRFLFLLLWLAALSATAQSPGHSVITIGDTASCSASSYLPFQMNRATTSQQLILSSEMNGPAIITGIDLYCTTASSTGSSGCTIYLGHTFLPYLVSGMAPYGARFEQVSVEAFACTTGWNHYELDSAFFYNGVDNLVLMVCAPSGYTTNMRFAACSTSQPLASYASYSQPVMPSYIRPTWLEQRNVMRIHMEPATAPTRCPAPTMWFDSIGADAVRVVWSPGYQDTSWVVRCITDGDTAWRNSGRVWGDTTYTMTGLTPNTNYEFRLTAFCTDTETTITKHVHTTCIPDTVPYTEGFEASYNLLSCWDFTPGGWGVLPGTNTTNKHQGVRSVILNGGTAILPPFDVPPDSLELQFWARNGVAGNPNLPLIIGMVIDPSDTTSFLPIDTVNINSSEWVPFVIQTDSYPRTMGRIAIKAQNPNVNYIYIDDIQVHRLSFCPTITGVTVDQVTDTSAVIHWPNSGAAYYEVAYGTDDFNPDTATVVTDIHADSLLLTGLDPYTRYTVYVRPECYTFATNWSPMQHFRTECALLDSVPVVENMEPYAGGTLPTDIPCWRGVVGANTCVANASAALPAYSGSKMLRWEQSLNSYGIQHVSLPAIDTAVVPLSTLQLEFWGMGIQSNRATPYLIVGVMTDPDDMATFQPIDTVAIGQNYMEHYIVSLENFRGPGQFVTLVDYSPSASQHWTAYLDDIVLCELPPCPSINNITITGITSNSVTLSIDSTRGAVAWQVCADTVGSAPSALPLPIWTSPNGTVPLVPLTTNYLWARTLCVKGDTSEWFGPVSAEPGVWNMRANRSDTMTLCGVTLYDDGGASGAAMPLQDSWLTLLPSEAGHLVTVSGSCYKGMYTERLEIYDADSTLLWTSIGNANNNYRPTLTFGPIISSSGLLRLHYATDSWGVLDDTSAFIQVQIACIPDTCVIKHLRADPSVPATDTTIAVIWECNGASLYEVEHGPVGFTPGNGTHATATTEHFVLTGLHSLDRRDIYVRSICGADDTGQWRHATFQTLPCPDALYRDNYDSTLFPYSFEISPIGMNNAPYSYIQTLIDPACLAGLENGITAMAVHPDNTAIEEYMAHVTVYLANVSDTAFQSTFIVPDSQHRFVRVIDSANFNRGLDTGWMVMPFDHPFLWDGHSQVLVAALRNDGGENGGRASYSSHIHHRNAMCYHAASTPIDIDSAGTCIPFNYVGDIRLFSNLCHAVICATPAIDSVGGDYESATLAWHGDGTDYQVKITPDPNNEGVVITSATSHTFAGLQPATTYTLSVRKDCTSDFLGYSDWVTATFTTEPFDCLPPSDLAVTNLDHESATFIWTADSPCRLRVWDDEGREWFHGRAVSPFIIDEFVAGCAYHVAISSYCGSSQQIEGPWSTPLDFSTLECLPPDDFSIIDRSSHSVTLGWTSDNPCRLRLWDDAAADWYYDSVMAPFTIDSLAEGTTYYVSISNRCGSRQPAAVVWSDSLSFTTACHPVVGLYVENAASHSITVAWDADDNAQGYRLQYGAHPYTIVEGADTIVAGSRCQIDGLVARTGYDIYVRTQCGEEWYAADYASLLNVFTLSDAGIAPAAGLGADFTLTPNPARSRLSVAINDVSPRAELTFRDAAGREVRRLAVKPSGTVTIDIAGLPSGIYFVTLTTPTRSATKKLVKQ